MVKTLHVSQVSRVSVINIRVDPRDTPEPNYSSSQDSPDLRETNIRVDPRDTPEPTIYFVNNSPLFSR